MADAYVQNLIWAVENGEGGYLSEYFSLKDKHVEKIVELQGLMRRGLAGVDEPFRNFVVLHLRAACSFASHEWEAAFQAQVDLVQAYNKEALLKLKDENWFLNAGFAICTDLVMLARLVERQVRDTAKQSHFYEQAAKVIMECYRSCVNDFRASAETTKKLAILNLTNLLFKVYFRINKMNLLKPLVRSIENCGALYDSFAMCDKVTYKYFVGRKAMFDNEFSLAENCLSFAFRNCLPECTHNRRLILTYLVPVKMFLGHMPSDALLRKYNLMQFQPIAQALRQGNLRLFETAMHEHQGFYIHCGIYLMLDRLKLIGYRTLFKRICTILGTAQISLDLFVQVLRSFELDEYKQHELDAADVACTLSILIADGKIKGYISHNHQKLVISKQNAFPSLAATI